MYEAILDDKDTPPFDDPFAWFGAWLGEAEADGMTDPNAMSVATVDAEGQPSVRTVLLKGFDPRGFVFYTNTTSRKGLALADNPRCALLLFWRELRRQIRVRGPVEPVSPEEADAYFASRARESRLGAWASNQSRPLRSRADLAERYHEAEARFEGREPTRPPHWSGYRVRPEAIEFWEARRNRLHVRWEWTQVDDAWLAVQLNP